MLNQVAETTGHPLLTPLGQSVFPVDTPYLSSFSPRGSSPRTCRCAAAPSTPIHASPKRIAFPGTTWPWCRFCAASGWASRRRPCAFSRKCRSSRRERDLGRDIAIGVVYFTLAFFLAFGLFAATFHSAIDRRRQLERELEE